MLRGEDLLLSVLVVELDNVFLHNLYLKDQIIWKLSGTFPKGRPIKLINPNLEKYQIFKMSPAGSGTSEVQRSLRSLEYS